MSADFRLKVNDTLPVLEATLLSTKTDRPIDVSTATSVVFRMRIKQSDPFIDITATIVDDGTEALRGRVNVSWSATPGSTSVAGSYKALFKVTFPGPLTLSVPNSGCKQILIEEDC